VTDTTPSPDSGDITNAQENWEGRYAGLQKVLAKRDTELTTANTSLDALRTEHEQALADLATYRQRDVDASEEEQARAQYESLKARFGAEETHTPVGNNAARGNAPAAENDWLSGNPSGYQSRERTGTGSGWPIG
jgi:hypothetical protein